MSWIFYSVWSIYSFGCKSWRTQSFPAGRLAPEYIKDLKAVVPAEFIATGAVNADNIKPSNKRAIKRLLKSPTSTYFDEFDRLTSNLLNEWKCLDRGNRLKILQYIEEIKTPSHKNENQEIVSYRLRIFLCVMCQIQKMCNSHISFILCLIFIL